MSTHRICDHDSTPAARRACRKQNEAQKAATITTTPRTDLPELSQSNTQLANHITRNQPVLPYNRPVRQTVVRTADDGTRYLVYVMDMPYADLPDTQRMHKPCWKCNGSGLYNGATYVGKCFACDGRGYKGTMTIADARADWQQIIDAFEKTQDRDNDLRVARMLAEQGMIVNADGTVTNNRK